MSEVWLVEYCDRGQWLAHPEYTSLTETKAKKYAEDARLDLIPEYMRIARYTRDEKSVQP